MSIWEFFNKTRQPPMKTTMASTPSSGGDDMSAVLAPGQRIELNSHPSSRPPFPLQEQDVMTKTNNYY